MGGGKRKQSKLTQPQVTASKSSDKNKGSHRNEKVNNNATVGDACGIEQHNSQQKLKNAPDYLRKRSSSRQCRDVEFDKFEPVMCGNSEFNFERVAEKEGDLFVMSDEYCLAHCVAEDMNMGSGIAVKFKQIFKRVCELLEQRQKQGGLAFLRETDRYIYYLVTKRVSSGKPTYLTLWKSLQRLKTHMVQNSLKKLALPRIGCGLDGLEWSYVKKMLEHIFQDTDIEIIVCNFQQTDELSVGPVKRKCKVVNERKVITELENYSIIIYLGSEDGYVTDEIKSLDEKFNILKSYRSETRTVGEPLRTYNSYMKYIFYCFIVRKKKVDPFSYSNFQKCLNSVQKLNRKDMYEYVGMQAFEEKGDELVMSKVVNLLRNSLTLVDIYICWPPHLQEFMPKIS